jgi:hypothetical protein
MPSVIDTAEKYREELIANDAKALGRLVRAYRQSFDNLKDKLELLTRDIADGNYTASQVHKLERYRSLMAQVAEQLRDLQGLTRQEMEAAANLGVELGIRHSRGLIAATLGNENLAVAFNKLSPEVVKTLTGFLDPDGPLYKRLSELSSYGAQRIADDLTGAIVAGFNPVKTAEIFRRAWGMSLTDAMRMTRTVQLYSYREATRANYIANSDVVEGWIWHADLDADTCAECIAMDGTRHDNDETLNDHHNGRCAMIPIVKGFEPIIEEGRGEAWFNAQSESVQRDMLGPGKYEAWKEGKFELSDLTKIVNDPIYGDMRTEMTLKELIGAEN